VATSATASDGGADHLSQRNFQRLATFIEGYSGIKMPPTKVTMIEGRLRRRLRATGMADLKQYCDFLFDKNGLAAEAIHLIDVMTTNKTEFFREPDHFRFLAEQAVPRLLSKAKSGTTALKVWSAACSSGAEPYTLAMVLADLAQQNAGLHYGITATDISTEVLDVAISGIYPEAMVAPVPPEFPPPLRFALEGPVPPTGAVGTGTTRRGALCPDQPYGGAVSGRARHGHHLLPQYPDLFRQRNTAGGTATPERTSAPRRVPVSRPLGNFGRISFAVGTGGSHRIPAAVVPR
jgi:hypothetical protein